MAIGNGLVPLTLGLIEEGEFKLALDEHLLRAQAALIAHIEQWGERAGKAKASVEMTIELECASVDDGVFSITSRLKLKTPARPPRPTAAMSGYDKVQGQAVLFCRTSGTTPGDPRQTHMPFNMDEKAPTDADARSEA